MTRWFGFTQQGYIIALGEHENFDDADATEDGRNCIWIWDEKNMRKVYEQIGELL